MGFVAHPPARGICRVPISSSQKDSIPCGVLHRTRDGRNPVLGTILPIKAIGLTDDLSEFFQLHKENEKGDIRYHEIYVSNIESEN